ncbi:MAG: hypothetical protein NT108_01790 [Candidatus Kaiserbacteria bacterium]|nr:hypothetical protein [Candidatus Kaiserbacteria bacterium]
MRIASLLAVIVLVFGFAPVAEASEELTREQRDALVNLLDKDISQFTKEGRLSEKGQIIADRTLASLILDSPLKTVEEMKDEDRLNSQKPKIMKGGKEAQLLQEKVQKIAQEAKKQFKEAKEQIREKLRKDVAQYDEKGRPLPPVTTDVAYDLTRLWPLKKVLKEEGLESPALDALFAQALRRYWLRKDL